MSEVVSMLALVLGSAATIAALLTVIAFLLPGFVGRCRRALETMAGRSLAVGAVNFIFFAAVAGLTAIIGAELPEPLRGLFNLGALIILLLLLALAAAGLAGLVALLRDRVSLATSPFAGMMWAGVLLVAAALAPIGGWFVLAPLALLVSLGAAIIALVQRSPKA
jgi:hypothetical protein